VPTILIIFPENQVQLLIFSGVLGGLPPSFRAPFLSTPLHWGTVLSSAAVRRGQRGRLWCLALAVIINLLYEYPVMLSTTPPHPVASPGSHPSNIYTLCVDRSVGGLWRLIRRCCSDWVIACGRSAADLGLYPQFRISVRSHLFFWNCPAAIDLLSATHSFSSCSAGGGGGLVFREMLNRFPDR